MNQIWSNWESYIILFLLVWALVDDEANPSVYVNIQAESLNHSFSPIYLIWFIFSLCTVSEGWRVHFARLDFDDAASQEGSVLCFLCCGQYAIDQKSASEYAERFDMLELEIRTLLAANKLIRKGVLQTLSWKK